MAVIVKLGAMLKVCERDADGIWLTEEVSDCVVEIVQLGVVVDVWEGETVWLRVAVTEALGVCVIDIVRLGVVLEVIVRLRVVVTEAVSVELGVAL